MLRYVRTTARRPLTAAAVVGLGWCPVLTCRIDIPKWLFGRERHGQTGRAAACRRSACRGRYDREDPCSCVVGCTRRAGEAPIFLSDLSKVAKNPSIQMAIVATPSKGA